MKVKSTVAKQFNPYNQQTMKLSEFKTLLKETGNAEFKLPNGTLVPSHFHITEVGQIIKNYIDCGGKMRNERSINFQLFTADDFDHRLKAEKLLSIIHLSEEKLGLTDDSIEVEYQGETIGKYDLGFDGQSFVLQAKQTDCLAKDGCGIPTVKKKIALDAIGKEKSSCTPGSGCC